MKAQVRLRAVDGASEGRAVAPAGGRRGALPSGRAVVGGFLVALAAVGIVAALEAGDDGPAGRAVRLRHDVRAGAVLASGDLEVVPVDVPDGVGAGLAAQVADVSGRVALHDLAADSLVRRDDTVAAPERPSTEQVSFAVPAARALGRAFRPGERIDVLATFEDGAAVCTDRIVRRAEVADFRTSDGELGGDDDVVFVVSVDDPDTARLLTFAADTATLSVVSTTTATGDAPVRQCPQAIAALAPAIAPAAAANPAVPS